METASSLECCKAFMNWVERFGVPQTAISDNGNSFISNLYRDIMATFNIEVKFTPAYHAATNGAIERRHQTLKNALKASLVDMGNHHGDKWTQALPWVLLGKRAALQPDLDASASMLAFGRSPCLPGQLMGEPGPPLSNLQTKALLEELYKLDNKPAIQTSATVDPIDISYTDKITHVYVKVDEPRGLSPRFEGPYKVVSRPSRSQVQVRVGSFANGDPRLVTFHWSSCKPAHMRQDAPEGSRPNLGRRPEPTAVPSNDKNKQASPVSPAATRVTTNHETSNQVVPRPSSSRAEMDSFENRPPPHPNYVAKGPIITREMFDKWSPDMLGLPSNTRPARSTRNPTPRYVDAMINS